MLGAALVAVEAEEVHMNAQPTRVDKVAAVEAAAANAIEAVCIPWTALAQCGIVAVARSLESLAQRRDTAMCYRKQKGSGIPTAVAFVEDGREAAAAVAVRVVVQVDMCARVLGYTANAAVLGLVGGPGTVYEAAAP